MDSFKSQVINVVNTVDKLDLQDRLEALSYLQKITEAYKNKALPSNAESKSSINIDLNEAKRKIVKHKCKNYLCLVHSIKHLKKIACFKCDKRLETEFQLFEHSQSHLDHPLSCILCQCTFRNVEDYNSHKSTDCKQISKDNLCNFEKYVCTVCHTSFSNKKTFQSHLLISHGTKLYNNWYGCRLCHQMFEQKKMLYHHYKYVHSESNCPWEIKKKRDSVSTHSENSNPEESSMEPTEEEKFQCVHCDRTFKRKSILSLHVKRHLRKQEIACTLCKKTFSQYRNYKRHLQTASHQSKDGLDNHPLFKCERCDKVFVSVDALSRHNFRSHANEDRQLKCPLCNFKTTLSASLSRHINLHTDNRKFICDKCGSCFHTLSALKDHSSYVHSKERNYSCEICGQSFKLKSGLNRHFITHSTEKEFKCFCGQLFKFRTNLKRHLLRAHKMTDKKSILRVTTEEEGYAMNSPKAVQRKTSKQRKEADAEACKMDDFDISSLSALSYVDLSCADEVLRETYDNLAKFAAENGETQESFNSILAPVNSLIDRVLHETAQARLKQTVVDRFPTTLANDALVAEVSGQLLSASGRGSTCRQYMAAASFADLSADQYAQIAAKLDGHFMSQPYDNANIICDAFNRPYLPEIQVEDEASFGCNKWLNEIL